MAFEKRNVSVRSAAVVWSRAKRTTRPARKTRLVMLWILRQLILVSVDFVKDWAVWSCICVLYESSGPRFPTSWCERA